MCGYVWHLHSSSKYQLLILDPNSGKFPSQGDTPQRREVDREGGQEGTGWEDWTPPLQGEGEWPEWLRRRAATCKVICSTGLNATGQ